MADRKVIILGCGGFVGSHLIERLLSDGRFEVLGFDVADSKCQHLLGDPNFHFTKGYVDVTNTEQVLGPVLDGAEAIFSLAAVCNPAEYVKNPVFTINSNFIHAYKLVELCTKANSGSSTPPPARCTAAPSPATCPTTTTRIWISSSSARKRRRW